jgi:putative ABC transport system permease protein
MHQLGWDTPEEAIGQKINWSIGEMALAYGPIVGIVKDFHQETLKNTVDPVVMVNEPIVAPHILN